MVLTILGVFILGMWTVVCYSLCRVASAASRQEEEEKRKAEEIAD